MFRKERRGPDGKQMVTRKKVPLLPSTTTPLVELKSFLVKRLLCIMDVNVRRKDTSSSQLVISSHTQDPVTFGVY